MFMAIANVRFKIKIIILMGKTDINFFVGVMISKRHAKGRLGHVVETGVCLLPWSGC